MILAKMIKKSVRMVPVDSNVYTSKDSLKILLGNWVYLTISAFTVACFSVGQSLLRL